MYYFFFHLVMHEPHPTQWINVTDTVEYTVEYHKVSHDDTKPLTHAITLLDKA